MKRILFVDDEPRILEGLRDLLRKHRETWDMVFVTSGSAALAEFERSPFDAIVSDMRMPGMDGAALLQAVKDRYPRTARIILSGHADPEAVLRALPVAQQYLSKPCDEGSVRAVVERVCALQDHLHNDRVRALVGKMDALPSVPRLYAELVEAIESPRVGSCALTRIVEQDAAMVARVLQLVNSAYYGLASTVTSVEQALFYLGTERLKTLVLMAHVFAPMKYRIGGFSIEQLQQHSMMVAQIASRFSEVGPAHQTFTAGVLHDIGKIVFAIGARDRFAEVVGAVSATNQSFHVVEKEVLGVSHAEAGAYLLGMWGVPATIVEAVAFHHEPGLAVMGSYETVAAIHVADSLAKRRSAAGAVEPHAPEGLDMDFLERTGLLTEFPRWQQCAAEEFDMRASGR